MINETIEYILKCIVTYIRESCNILKVLCFTKKPYKVTSKQ